MSLQAILKEKGMMQKDLAEISGVSTSAISNYASGKRIPTGKELEQIITALGCTREEVIGNAERHLGRIELADRLKRGISNYKWHDYINKCLKELEG